MERIWDSEKLDYRPILSFRLFYDCIFLDLKAFENKKCGQNKFFSTT